jgi:hypothetical protein
MAGSVSLLGQAIPAGTNGVGLLAALLAKVAVGLVVFAGAVWLLAPEVFREVLSWAGRPVARDSRA